MPVLAPTITRSVHPVSNDSRGLFIRWLTVCSKQIIALDSEGDDPAQFGMVGWQAPNAAGASAFQVRL